MFSNLFLKIVSFMR